MSERARITVTSAVNEQEPYEHVREDHVRPGQVRRLFMKTLTDELLRLYRGGGNVTGWDLGADRAVLVIQTDTGEVTGVSYIAVELDPPRDRLQEAADTSRYTSPLDGETA